MARWAVLLTLTLSGCDWSGLENTLDRFFPREKLPEVATRGGPEFDYRRIVSSSEKINVVSGKDSFGYPLVTADKTEIVNLLLNQEFGKLTAVLVGYQKHFEDDFRREYWLFDAYDAFRTADPTLSPYLDRWIEQQPDSHPPYIARAIHRQAMGWKERGGKWARDTAREQFQSMERYFAKAEEDLEISARIDPQCLVILGERLTMYRARGDRTVIDRTYQRTQEIQPLSFVIQRSYLATLLPRWGGSYRQMARHLNEIQPLFEENPKLKLLVGTVAWDVGRNLVSKKRYADAIENYTEALSYGEYDTFFQERAYAYYRSERYDLALDDLERAQALDPQDPDTFYWLAWTLYRLGRLEDAVAHIDTAVSLDPGDEDYSVWRNDRAKELVYHGYELYKEERYQEALAELSNAALADPRHGETYYWKGQALLRLERYEEAKAAYYLAIRLAPDHIDAHRSLDWILARSGRWDEVISIWDGFIVSHPDNADAYLERAGAYRHSGDLEAAFADLDQSCLLGNQKACEIRGRNR